PAARLPLRLARRGRPRPSRPLGPPLLDPRPAGAAASKRRGNSRGGRRVQRTHAHRRVGADGMTQTTTELALEVLDAISHRDLERAIALADPEVEWHSFFADLGA